MGAKMTHEWKQTKGKDDKMKKEEDDVKKEEDDDMSEEGPQAQLTEEEKLKWLFKSYWKAHLPNPVPDIHSTVFSACFGQFTVPSAEEGFDEIIYDWAKEDKAKAYVKKWVLDKKLS